MDDRAIYELMENLVLCMLGKEVVLSATPIVITSTISFFILHKNVTIVKVFSLNVFF